MPPEHPEDTSAVLPYATPGQTPRVLDGLVTAATFDSTWEAHLAAGKVEAEGIFCSIADANVSGLGGGVYTGLVGGIKLQVPAADLERARAALPSRVRTRVTRCPRCRSTDTIEIDRTPGEKILFLLLLGIPYLFIEKRWLCHACTHAWQGPGEQDSPHDDPKDDDDEDDDDEQVDTPHEDKRDETARRH
jgi:hypothetical protein